MTKPNPQPSNPNNNGKQQQRRDKPTLGGETVEARILLSATWITGTDGAETINGTSGDDVLEGLAGNDTLVAGSGDDILRGGAGDDSLQGGLGTDTADYSEASGSVTVDLSNNTATGADGNDTLSSIERVVGSRAADNLIGGSGDDTLEGGGGNDVIQGGAGNDCISGGAGDDYIFASYGDDVVDGGTGGDTIDYQSASSSVTVDLTLTTAQDTGGGGIDTLSNIERVIGSSYNDTFAFANPSDGDLYTIDGNGGSNTIDLSNFAAASISSGRDAIKVDLGGGQSFQINYSNVASVVTADSTFDPSNRDADYKPTPDAGAEQWVTEGDVVSLNGLASNDADGDTLTYKWVQTSGPAVTLDDCYSATPSFTAPEGLSNFDLQFTLVVNDGKYEAQSTVAIHVSANNDLAAADAGSMQIVNEGDVVRLDATASSDPEGQSLTYTWVQTSGPAVTLSDANAAQPTFTAPGVATNTNLTFDLQVSDGVNTSSVDSVTIQVGAWLEGTSGDDTLSGTDGDDQIRTFDGNDTLTGGAGNDVLDGGTGSDTVDYSGASGGVQIDLTLTSAQDTVSDGTDTLSNIEGVIGSAFNDTFSFSSPVDGAVYTIDGGGGTNTIDLSNFSSSDVTFGNGTITIDLGSGQSFQVVHSNVRDINFGDVSAKVITAGISAGSWIGSGIFVDGAQAFRIDQSGAGSINWSYTDTTDTFRITDTTGTDATTDIVIQDLNGTDLVVSNIIIDRPLGSLTSNVDIATITITSGSDNIGTITVAGGSGTIGSFATTSGNLHGTSVINANVTTISLNSDLKGPLTVNGNVGGMTLNNVAPGGDLHVTGNVGNLTSHDIQETVQIDGSLTSLTANKIEAPTNVGGDVGSFVAANVKATVTIAGDLGSAVLDTVSAGGTVVVNSVVGILDFRVNMFQHGGLFVLPTEYTFSGSTGSASFQLAGNVTPVANAGSAQTVSEGDLVTLTGLGSFDADGDALSYTWVQTSGPAVVLSNANAAQPTFTAPEGLTNTAVAFELQVHDGNASSVVDTVTITINADNDAPSANAGIDQVVNEGDLVTLSAAGSSDPEAQGLTYTWVQTSGPAVTLSDANACVPTFTAPDGLSNTDITFDLQVSDGTNVSSSTVTVTVNANNDAPTAEAGPNQVQQEGSVVTLNGSASSDPEGQGLTYSWRQVSGPTVQLSDANQSQAHFTAPDLVRNTTVQFELTVSDGVNTATDTISIGIGADDDAPSVDAGRDLVVLHNQEVQLTATARDPEGVGLTYVWQQTDGPRVELSNADTDSPTFTAPNLPSGTVLTFRVAASDAANTSYDTVTIVVAPNSGPSVQIVGNNTANAGEVLVLNASAKDLEGDNLTYRWTQVSGPSVALTNPGQSQLQFLTPTVSEQVALSFQVEVSDGNRTSVQTVTITVQGETAGAASSSSGFEQVVDANATNDPPTTAVSTAQAAAQSVPATTTESSFARSSFSPSSFDEPTEVANTTTESVSLSTFAAARLEPESTLEDAMRDTEVDRSPTIDPREATTEEEGNTISGIATDNLLAVATGTANTASLSATMSDLIVADAGTAVVVRAPVTAVAASETAAQVRWKQISGTPVAIDDDSSASLSISLPEVFAAEEVVFSVEVVQGGETIQQEVTVQVQPVGMTNRSLSIDEHVAVEQSDAAAEGDTGSRGFGKIWGALLAFFGTQTGRKNTQ